MAPKDFLAELAGLSQTPNLNTVEVKKQNLEQTSANKKAALGGVSPAAAAIVDTVDGNQNNYQPASITEAIAGQNEASRLLAPETRDVDQKLGDLSLQVGSGAANLVGGLAALGNAVGSASGLGEVTDPTLGSIDRGLNQVSEYLQSNQSRSALDRQEARQVRNQNDDVRSDAQYEADIQNGMDSFDASTLRIGRDIKNTLSNMNFSDIADVVAQNIPSLVATAGTGSLFAKGAVSLAAKRAGASADEVTAFLGSKIGQKAIQDTSVALQPLLNGVLEGSGAAQATMQEINGMSEEDLIKNSPQYAEMLKTMNPQEARRELAGMAGLRAGITQGIAGGAAGKLSAKFDADPLATVSGKGSIVEALKSIGKETIEEASQGGTGQFFQNEAIQAYGDKNQSLSEGIGQNIAESAIGGMGLSSTTQGPAVVGESIKVGAEKIAKGISDTLNTAAEEKTNASPVSNLQIKNIGIDFDAIKKNLPSQAELDAKKNAPKTEEGETPFVDPSLQKQRQLADALSTASIEFEPGTEDGLKANVSDEEGNLATNKISMFAKLADIVSSKDKKYTDQDKLEAASFMVSLQNDLQDVARTESEDDSEPVKQLYTKINETLKIIEQNPSVKEAVDRINNAEINLPDITEENVSSLVPELTKVAALADVNPAKITPEIAQKIENAQDTLDQAGIRPIINKRVRQIVKAGAEISELLKNHETNMLNMKLEGNNNPEEVARLKATIDRDSNLPPRVAKVQEDILTEGFRKNGSSDAKPALMTTVRDIYADIKAGNTDLAIKNLTNLKNFGISQTNKLKALDTSAKNNGELTHYDAWGTFGWYNTANDGSNTSKPLKYVKNNPNSTRFADTVYNDTYAVVGTYNALVKAFPELGLEQLPVPQQSRSISQHAGRQRRLAALKEAGIAPTNTDVVSEAPVEAPTAVTPMEATPVVKNQEKAPTEAPTATTEAVTRDARKVLGPRPKRDKKPLTEIVKKISKGIDPNSSLGKELIANDITPKSNPGLFKKGGNTSLDGIPSSELPELYGLYDSDSGDGYLDPNKLVQGIIEENNGIEQQIGNYDEVAAWDKASEALEREAEQKEEKVESKSEPKDETESKTENKVEDLKVIEKEEVEKKNSSSSNVSEKPKKKTFKDVFPRMITDVFEKAFKLKSSGIASMDDDKVINTTVKALESEESFKEALLNKNSVIPSKEQLEELRSLIKNLSKIFYDKLNADYSGEVIQKAQARALELGLENWTLYPNMLPVNFKESNGSKEEINSKVLAAVTIATANWLYTSRLEQNMDYDDVKKIFPEIENISSPLIRELNKGQKTTFAAIELAQDIQTYLGVSPKDDAEQSTTDGMFLSLALDVLANLENEGYVKTIPVVLAVDDKGKVTKYITLTAKTAPGKELEKALANVPNAIEDLFFKERIGRQPSIGEPVKNVPKYKMHSNFVELTKAEQKAVDVANNIKYTLNKRMNNTLTKLGPVLFNMFSDPLNTDMNVNHQKSVKGVVDGFARSLEAINQITETLKDLPEDIGVYFAHGISAVGRLQQLGTVTPQGDKGMREVLSATNAVVDLTDPNQEATGNFWLSAAQALGVKTEKLLPEKAIEKVKELSNKAEYREMIELLKKDTLSKEEQTQFAKLFNTPGHEGTMKELHALAAIADYEKASPEELKAFRHSLALEADGKTDGPINAIMNFLSGFFNKAQFAQMARGGVILSKAAKSLNQYLTENAGTSLAKDLYEVTADRYNELLKLNEEKFTPEYKKAISDLLAFAGYIDIVFTEDGFIANRVAVKNPLTITTYGSGANGMAEKLANAIVDGIYAEATKAIRNNDVVDFNKKADSIRSIINIPRMNTVEQLKKFTVKTNELNSLTVQMKEFFINPLLEAINDEMGNTNDNMRIIQQATQLQSELMKALYTKAIEEKRAELKNKSGITQYPSRKDQRSIFKLLQAFSSLIEMPEQTAHIASSESELTKDDFGKSIAKRMLLNKPASIGANGKVWLPQNVGVKASPFFNIMTGDGKMILKILNGIQNEEELKHFADKLLMVFDGVEMPIDGIQPLSQFINKKVWEGWMENPSRALLDNFEAMTRVLSTDVPQDVLDTVAKNIRLAKGESIENRLSFLVQSLNRIANETEARKYALKHLGISIDHMASGSNPYYNKGFTSDDIQAVVDYANKKYSEKLAQLQKQEAVKPASDKLTERILSLGSPVSSDSKVVKLTFDKMKGVFHYLNQEQKQLLGVVLNNKNARNAVMFYGTREELTALRDSTYPNDKAGPIKFGQYDPTYNNLYITNASGETIIHEMLHAALADKVRMFVERNKNLSSRDEGAFKRILELMNEFLSLEPSELDHPIVQAFQENLDSWIRTDPEKAINEFIAYGLTNENISKVLKQQKARGKLATLFEKALRLLSIIVGVPNSMASHLRFNAEILLKNNKGDDGGGSKSKKVLNQDLDISNRISELKSRIDHKLKASIEDMGSVDRKMAEMNVAKYITLGDRVIHDLSKAGYSMNGDEAYVFKRLYALLQSGLTRNSTAGLAAQDLYELVSENLLERLVTDPLDTVNVTVGTNKYHAVIRSFNSMKDSKTGISDRIPAFLALLAVNDDFRKTVDNIEIPKKFNKDFSSLDSILYASADYAIDRINELTVGTLKDKNVVDTGDKIITKLTAIERNKLNDIEENLQRGVSSVNDKVSDLLQSGIDKTIEFIEPLGEGKKKNFAFIPATILSVFSEKKKDKYGVAIRTILNSSHLNEYTALNNLFSEIRGIATDNKEILKLINKVRYSVSAMREEYREKVPNIIKKQFSRELSEEEWSVLHTLGSVDVASLLGSYQMSTIKRLFLDDRAIDNELNNSNIYNTYKKDINALAHYLATGEASNNMRKNAFSIGQGKLKPDEVKELDQMITLAAIKKLDSSRRISLNKLFNTESNGIEFSLNYIRHLKEQEENKSKNNFKMKYNQWKGYIPTETRNGSNVIVAEDGRFSELEALGYERIGDFTDPVYGTKMGYYLSNVAGKATYSQGILQTVTLSQNGADAITGRSVKGDVGYTITGKEARILGETLVLGKPFEDGTLVPVYDEDGNIIAIEVMKSQKKNPIADQNTNLAEMLGAWSGRQVEEKFSQSFNNKLLELLYDKYREDKRNGFENEYVNLATSTDPLHREVWKVIPKQIKDDIENTFGEEKFFPVRRDLIDNTLGFRNSSIQDMWTGITHIHPEVQKAITNTLTLVFGKEAMKYAVTAEKYIQEAVSAVKQIIVVKSLVVPFNNIRDNILQLSTNGVSVSFTVKNVPVIFNEINRYLENRDKGIEYQAMLKAAKTENEKVKLQSKIQALRDTNKKMLIAPLIEAGEFQTLSEGLAETDAAIADGKFVKWVEDQVDKLPDNIKEMGQYAMISRGTALYKGLNRAVQYGDFIAKSILYLHNLNQGMNQEEALEAITEEFVNYNFSAGRTRTYMESIGLLWFWSFKLRSMKVAAKTLRKNPLRVLVNNFILPETGLVSSGSPVTDNFVGTLAQGKLPYSMGPGMLLSGFELHPTVALFK